MVIQDQKQVAEELTLQEFYEVVCNLDDRTRWYRDLNAEWTWKEVSNDFTSVVREYETIVPPDALREFHEVTLELVRRIVELAESQDPDGLALFTHVKADASTSESLEKLGLAEVEVERVVTGLDPEIHAYFLENRCRE